MIKVIFCEIKNTKNVIREYYKTRKIGPHYQQLKLLEIHLKNTTSEFTLILNLLNTVPETTFHNAKSQSITKLRINYKPRLNQRKILFQNSQNRITHLVF